MLVARQARVAVYHAIDEARRHRQPVVDTGHLLVAVMGSSDAVVHAVRCQFGLDVPLLRATLAILPGTGSRGRASAPAVRAAVAGPSHAVARRPAAFSPDARRVLGRAFVHARTHRARRLTVGHMLLAITAQHAGDRARMVLTALGVDSAALADAVSRRLLDASGRGRGGQRRVNTPDGGTWQAARRGACEPGPA